MALPHQLALMELPQMRRAFKYQRRLLIIPAADAITSGGIASLNRTATLFKVPASWLSEMLQRYRAGGDKALLPKLNRGGDGCHISFFVRTS